MKKNGFTLAEILITIGILGIIAAVTLPAINGNINNNALEKQTLKFYTQAQKAFDLYKVNNESDSIIGLGLQDNVDGFVKEYFSVAETCSKAEDCLSKEYGFIDSKNIIQTSSIYNNKFHMYKLKDGSVFSIDVNEDSIPIAIFFDVNGKKGPNIAGRDFWTFSVFYDGSIDEGGITPEKKAEWTSEELKKNIKFRFDNCKNGTYGGCFGHFMRNGFKFDY